MTSSATDQASSLQLLIWLSPSFPVGAFAYSQGLEWAVEDGAVHDAATLEAWLVDLVAHGPIRADAVLLAAAWRAADPQAALAVNELALALAPSHERRLETATQGSAFLRAVAAAWLSAPLDALATALGEEDIAYPVAVGVAAAAHAIALRPTLAAFALAAITNLVSAALRLGPIGQSEAQAIIARVAPRLEALAAATEHAGLDDLGTCALRADIASMRHETQYSRLFRS
ncbi:Urease accessory protein UreF [Beijerinckiaceae bacterium RH AL1]|nr:Urease accessory protein UreF [Beijerinckiaceae bacterium RH AL8]VVB43084.1 Urease accessory protein UreF [Beijerinckiaceae bacterium RH CH11]VVC53653.1 Urease accessory protein UreF [Beijerinckiaceae bacterium RH AL1]